MSIDEKAFEAAKKKWSSFTGNDKSYGFEECFRSVFEIYEGIKSPDMETLRVHYNQGFSDGNTIRQPVLSLVDLEKCTDAIEDLFEEAKDDPTAGIDELKIAKAVLDAAGVPYVD